MQIAPTLKIWSSTLATVALLSACSSGVGTLGLHSSLAKVVPQPTASTKTESAQGEVVGELVDCDGDGFSNESRLDFDGDGVPDECVEGVGAIPEPPFQQSYTPTSEVFSSLLPEVGWNASYQCGDDLYEISLRRSAADAMEYSAQGLTLTSEIVYDDLDPNLNQPLIIQEPAEGIRYAFTQEADGEFYEYAIADYSGNIGLYIYQTGEQIVAVPCTVTTAATNLPMR